MRINFRRLEVFCTVVEEGGVTRAAERLYVAQPAVSSQLRALEQWLGAKLFARNGARLELTEVGQRTYEWAHEVLASGEEIHREVAGMAAGTGGSVVISASMGVGSYLMPQVLANIRVERPNADVTLHSAVPQEALHALELGKSDFAVLSWDDQETPETIVDEPLIDEPLLLLAAPDGPPDTDLVSIPEVRELPFVWVPRVGAFGTAVEQQLRVNRIGEIKVMIRLGHAEAMKRVVIDQRWVTFLPRFAVEQELKDGRLRAIQIEGVQMTDNIRLFFRRDKRFSPLQKAAMSGLRTAIAERQALGVPVG